MPNNFLFIMREAPHGNIRVQENLDMILTSAAFDQTVRLLFLDEGVLQLMPNQKPDAIGFKQIAPIFASLDLYDVKEFWIESESLKDYELQVKNLILPLRLIERKDIARFISAQDIVVSC